MAKNEKHLLSAEPPSFVRIANSIKPKPNLLNANKILFLLRWISIAIQTTLQTHNRYIRGLCKMNSQNNWKLLVINEIHSKPNVLLILIQYAKTASESLSSCSLWSVRNNFKSASIYFNIVEKNTKRR